LMHYLKAGKGAGYHGNFQMLKLVHKTMHNRPTTYSEVFASEELGSKRRVDIDFVQLKMSYSKASRRDWISMCNPSL